MHTAPGQVGGQGAPSSLHMLLSADLTLLRLWHHLLQAVEVPEDVLEDVTARAASSCLWLPFVLRLVVPNVATIAILYVR